MTDKKVAEETVSKALKSLQDLAKGHSSRGTATTAVDSMRDAAVGAGSDAGSTQVYHTPANSDPGQWAGSRSMSCPEDGATDSIEEDGTDYKGVSTGLMKSIFNKLAKGEALSEAEQFVLKSVAKAGYAMDDKDDEEVKKTRKAITGPSDVVSPTDYKSKAKKSVVSPTDNKSVNKAQDEDDDDDKDMDKSLEGYASANPEVRKGLEMSPFLAGWAEVQHESAQAMEERIVGRLAKSISRMDNSNANYQAEMAKSMAALAEVLTAQAQRIEQLETAPARGPKSVQVQPVEKSFAGSSHDSNEQLSKSIILDTMIDMVQKGKLHAQDVVKFESLNDIRPDVYQAVLSHRAGR